MGGYQILLNLDSMNFFHSFVPKKNSRFFDVFIPFSKVRNKGFLPLALVEVALYRFRFHLSNIDPSIAIFALLRLAKTMILHQFLMFVLYQNRVE
jgi:hypothetical protein